MIDNPIHDCAAKGKALPTDEEHSNFFAVNDCS